MSKSIYNETYRELIDALKAARKKADVTQQQVADALGRPQSYVAKVEGYERRLDVIELIEFASTVGWNPLPQLEEAYRRRVEQSRN